MTKNEFNQAIEKMIPHKSPGLNGVSPNTIKALDNENRNMLFQICSDFPDSGVEIENWKINYFYSYMMMVELWFSRIGMMQY